LYSLCANATKAEDLFCLLGLLGEKNCLNVGQDTSLSNGDTSEELVQLFIVTDGQLQVSWDDSCLLVVTGGIASQLEYFSSQVLHDGSEVHWGTSTDAFSIVAFAKKTVDATNRELKSCT
jgi:hypothetical protein